MATPSITILSTLEHLGAYEGSSDVYFGLTLQVSSDIPPTAGDEGETMLLCPWLWDSASVKIHLWSDGRPGTTGQTEVMSTSVMWPEGPTPPSPALLANRAVLAASLAKDFKTLIDSNNQDIFAWTNGSPDAAVQQGRKALYKWPTHLSQVTRYPYPIPHILNLCFFFKVLAADVPAMPSAGLRYYAAPEFSFRVAGASADEIYTPQPPTSPPDAAGKYQITLNYTSPVGRTVQCRTLAINRESFTSDDQIDRLGALLPSNPYVRLRTPEQLNWQHLLTIKSSELFDTSARLLGALRDCWLPDDPVLRPQTTLSPAYVKAKVDIAAHFMVFLRLVLANFYRVGTLGLIKPAKPEQPTIFSAQFEQWSHSLIDSSLQGNIESFRQDLEIILQPPLDAGVLKPGSFTAWSKTLPATSGFTTFRSLLQSAEYNVSILEEAAPLPTSEPQIREFLAKLDQIHLLFVQPESLAAILLEPWQQSIEGIKPAKPDAWMKQWNSFKTFLQGLDLRSIVAVANLRRTDVIAQIAGAWDPDPAKRGLIRAKIGAELSARFLADTYQAGVADSINKAFFTAGSPWVDAQAKMIVPDATEGDEKLATEKSQGVTLVLDTLAPPAPTDKDILGETSGFCIFARESSVAGSVWQCLNIGVVQKPDSVMIPAQVLTPPTVIPLPLHDEDGMRHAMVTYNNDPLMMRSPAAEFGVGMARSSGSFNASDLGLQYLHPTLLKPPNTTDGKVPGLTFGKKYDFAAARVRSCGALPARFADPSRPGVLKANLKKDLPYALKSVEYKRTVAIGTLRFGSSSGKLNQTIDVPAIPADVNPIVRESSATLMGGSQQEPLVLLSAYQLAPMADTFVFSVAPPAIDLRTWDQYVAGVLSVDARIGIWKDYHEKATSGGEDVSIDDPAVKGVTVTLEHISGPPVNKPDTSSVLWSYPSSAASPLGYRAIPIAFKIAAMTGGSASISGTQIFVPEGGLYRLKFTLQLEPGAAAKFAKIRSGKKLLLPGVPPDPYTMVIETASSMLPTPSELRKVFFTDHAMNPQTGVDLLNFRLVPDQTQQSMRNIGSATLETQEWRWNGRPIDKFPYDKIKNLDDTSMSDWEAVAFTPRETSDATVRSLNHTTDSLSKRPSLSVSEDITPDPGARYFRSRVIVQNRYSSLVPPANRTSISSDPEPGVVNDAVVHWSRTFVEARLNRQMPVPAIKLILPLTESLAEDNDPQIRDAASLLVVLQGPWYALGGLAEDMEVRVAQLADKTYEYGPDPIEPVLVGFDPKKEPRSQLRGPVGHTFDENDISPLWVNSSFVLLPVQAPQVQVDSRNMFAKVQFRRRLSIAYEAAMKPLTSYSSEWTDPYWVQFLPSRIFSSMMGDFKYSDAALKMGADRKLTLLSASGKDIQISSDGTSKTHVQHFILLTELVPDLPGRAGQERFVDICERDGISWRYSNVNVPAPVSGKAVARILEVQTPFFRNKGADSQDLPSATDLLAYLFPSQPSEDAKARITAMSPPIYELSQQPCVVPGGKA